MSATAITAVQACEDSQGCSDAAVDNSQNTGSSTSFTDSTGTSSLPEARFINPGDEIIYDGVHPKLPWQTRVKKVYVGNRRPIWFALLILLFGSYPFSRFVVPKIRSNKTNREQARLAEMTSLARQETKAWIPIDDALFNQTLAFLATDPEMTCSSPNFLQRFYVVHFCMSASYNGNWTMHAAEPSDGSFSIIPGVEPVRWEGLNDEHECNWDGISCNNEKEVVGFYSIVENKQSVQPFKMIQMNGVFSDALFALPMLKSLRIPGAKVRGELPAKAVKALNLNILDLSGNYFRGEIPFVWSTSFRTLQRLSIADNSITGAFIIPGQNGGYCELLGIDVSGNSLNGTIPNALGKCSASLRWFFASFTELQGTLPSSMANLTLLERLRLDHSRLLDGDASSVVGLPNLKRLFVQETELSGNMEDRPTSASPITECNIAHSRFYGSVPEFVCGGRRYHTFIADCDVECPCCSECCNEKECIKLIP